MKSLDNTQSLTWNPKMAQMKPWWLQVPGWCFLRHPISLVPLAHLMQNLRLVSNWLLVNVKIKFHDKYTWQLFWSIYWKLKTQGKKNNKNQQSYLIWLVVSTRLKNMLVKLEIFPNFRGKNKKYLSCHHLDNMIIQWQSKARPQEIIPNTSCHHQKISQIS